MSKSVFKSIQFYEFVKVLQMQSVERKTFYWYCYMVNIKFADVEKTLILRICSNFDIRELKKKNEELNTLNFISFDSFNYV